MSRAGLASVARSIDEVKQVITSLTDEEWSRQSGCDAWTVRDLVAHMSSNYKETVEPSPPPPEPLNLPAERLMDLLVDLRDGWTHEQVRDEYLQYCDAALATLSALQDEPLASTVIPLADLGRYPMHLLADAYAFDHYCHLRVDLVAPFGPIERELPDADDALVGPAVGWMLAGIPQMQPGLEQSLTGRIRLVLTGPGGGTWDISRDGDAIHVGAPEGDPDVTVTSDAHDFVLWGTVRMPWREACTVEGDEQVAATFLDALNIV
jgi:uncharacterized protein (TIGR03083 family)